MLLFTRVASSSEGITTCRAESRPRSCAGASCGWRNWHVRVLATFSTQDVALNDSTRRSAPGPRSTVASSPGLCPTHALGKSGPVSTATGLERFVRRRGLVHKTHATGIVRVRSVWLQSHASCCRDLLTLVDLASCVTYWWGPHMQVSAAGRWLRKLPGRTNKRDGTFPVKTCGCLPDEEGQCVNAVSLACC